MQVIVIAMGEPKHIARYCNRLAPSLLCLTGETGGEEAYHMYGLTEGKGSEVASMDVLKAGFRALKSGHVGGVPVGNVKMLPGTFVINTDGRVKYTYYSKHIGDHPEIETLIQQRS